MANSPPPNNPSLGERRLAAIMFTDVVSFSARIQQSENLTLRLVQRDFKAITNACNACGGQVLKTTGDGLLMAFPTAGAAVDCALRVQKMVAHAGKTLPPEQMLEHRIGIHLGDVFVADNDVMGNDVNIAARVLSEAGGGEICVSQTVYDVVKHRLSVKGIYIGQRELKNIKEPVSIFRLPTSASNSRPPQSRHSRSRRNLQLAGAGILIAAVVAFTIWKFTVYQQREIAPIAAPATQPATRSVPRATAQVIGTSPRGARDGRIRQNTLGGINVAEVPDFTARKAYKVALSDNPAGAELTLIEGEVYRTRGPAGRSLGAITSPETMKLHIDLPDIIVRRMLLGFGDVGPDPNREPRQQTIFIQDPQTGQVLAQSVLANFREPVLVAFDVSGDFDVVIKGEKGPGTILQAVFFNARP